MCTYTGNIDTRTRTRTGWEWPKLLDQGLSFVIKITHTWKKKKKKTRKERISNRSGKNSVIDEDEDELEVVPFLV
jgi:hypothetical protein